MQRQPSEVVSQIQKAVLNVYNSGTSDIWLLDAELIGSIANFCRNTLHCNICISEFTSILSFCHYTVLDRGLCDHDGKWYKSCIHASVIVAKVLKAKIRSINAVAISCLMCSSQNLLFCPVWTAFCSHDFCILSSPVSRRLMWPSA